MNKVNYTNNYMVNAIAAINKCAPYASGNTAYAMLKNRTIFQNELVPFEEMRQQIFEKYGEKKENGEIVITKEGNEENYDKFMKELIDLMNIRMDVEQYKIPEEEFALKFEGDVTLYDYDLIHSIVCEVK